MVILAGSTGKSLASALRTSAGVLGQVRSTAEPHPRSGPALELREVVCHRFVLDPANLTWIETHPDGKEPAYWVTFGTEGRGGIPRIPAATETLGVSDRSAISTTT